MNLTNIAFDADKWTGHTSPEDRYVLGGVLIIGAIAFAIVAMMVL